MENAIGIGVKEALPQEAWSDLVSCQSAILVDVRTKEEWGSVGVPELSSLGKTTIFIEWQEYPNMSYNPLFVKGLMEEFKTKPIEKIFFICRSGVRSRDAAQTISNHLNDLGMQVKCVNVSEGFEGNLKKDKFGGCSNGWKARGLAWRQYQ
jgi:rhodanese-related sulfurtransferase